MAGTERILAGYLFGYRFNCPWEAVKASRIDAAGLSHCKCAYAIAGPALGPVWPRACNVSGRNNKLLKRKYPGAAQGPHKTPQKGESS